jgi:predicted ribosome quality control (RQC) complex YloA/Tae2 family protein
LNAHVFRLFCKAFNPLAMGARLQRINALSGDVIQFVFFGQGKTLNLVLKYGRQGNFIFTAARRQSTGAAPPPFIMRLRKHLLGRHVKQIHAKWLERQLWLGFSPQADLWLCLDLLEGANLCWQSPEPSDPVWPDPSALPPLEAIETGKLWPVLAPELRRTLSCLPEAEQTALLMDLESANGDLFLYEDAKKQLSVSAWPLPEQLRDKRREIIEEDILAGLARVGEQAVIANMAARAGHLAAKPFLAEAARLKRLLDKLAGERQRLQDMANAQNDATLLQGILFKFAPDEKRSSVMAENPADPSALPREIALDPRISIRRNMEALFHRAGRGRRGLKHLNTREQQVKDELKQAEELAVHAGQGFMPQGSMRRNMPQESPGKNKSLVRGVAFFTSGEGRQILRGQSAAGNLVVLKMARPHDLWLHAEGAAGAHVILRRESDNSLAGDQSLREAAILAALKSPFRDAASATVLCAQARHVHPMRGAKAGMVRIDKAEPSLRVEMDKSLEEKLIGRALPLQASPAGGCDTVAALQGRVR